MDSTWSQSKTTERDTSKQGHDTTLSTKNEQLGAYTESYETRTLTNNNTTSPGQGIKSPAGEKSNGVL